MGDLNYRINGDRSAIIEAMHQNLYEELLHNDQLCFEMKIGRVKGLYEGKIRFAPTYKRKPKKNTEISFKRNPAWTDRILYKFNDQECLLI
jgi:phosphatidylinositol-bisphosphatase